MNFKIFLFIIIILFISSLIFVNSDITLVLKAIEKAGYTTILLMVLVQCFAILLCGISWRILFISRFRNIYLITLWARYLRDSVGNILAIIPATGEIAATRELTFHGVKPSTAAATLLVDITAELISQLAFILMGLIILLKVNPESPVLRGFAIAFLFAIIGVALLLLAQRSGFIHFIERLPERLNFKRTWNTFPNEETLHPEIQAIYNERWRLPTSIFIHTLGWLLSAFEIWIALLLLNEPITYLNSIGLQSLVFAVRTVAIFVPYGAGVQEGGYVVIGSLIGIEPHIAIALSLMRRAREIVLSVPGIIVWQIIESHRVWKRHKK